MIEVFQDVTLFRAYGPNILKDCGAVIWAFHFHSLWIAQPLKIEGTTVFQNVGVRTDRNIFTFQETWNLSNSAVRTTNIADCVMCGGRVPLHYSYSCQAIFFNIT